MELYDYIFTVISVLLSLSFYLNIALSLKVGTLYKKIKNIKNELVMSDKELIKMEKDYRLATAQSINDIEEEFENWQLERI